MKNKKIFALIFLSALTISSFVLLTLFSPKNSLETRLYYNLNDAQVFFSTLNLIEVENYKMASIVDFFLILSYSGVFVLWGSGVNVSPFVSFIPGIFDLIETIAILGYLNGVLSLNFFNYLGAITFLKWLGFFFIIFYFLKKKLHRPSGNESN